MRFESLVIMVAMFVASLVASSTHSQEKGLSGTDTATGEPAKRIQELRAERMATLETMVDQLTTLFRAQRVQYDDVLEGQRLLIEAKLEAAETDEQRVTVYGSLVALLKAQETHAEAQAQAGRGLQSSVLKAKAKRLEAEIHLEQAKMMLAKTTE